MITIRKALIPEFINISELDRNAWTENRESEFIPDGEHIWRLWVEYALTFVACDNNEIIGAGVSIPTNDPKLQYVHKLMFSSSHRGKGIGTKLLSSMTQVFDEDGIYSMLSTDPENKAMQRVSEKCGFNEREFIKGYYRPSEDRWIYKRAPQDNDS